MFSLQLSGINFWANYLFTDHDVQAIRKERISKVCADLNISRVPMTKEMKFVLADRNHRIIYGEIPKVGATNWMNLLMSLTGKVTVDFQNRTLKRFTDRNYLRKIGLVYLDALSKEAAISMLQRYYKYVFVRHPFTRLLAAYRDKIWRGDLYYQRTYGYKILKLFRPWVLNVTKSRLVRVRFPEFVQYIIYLHRQKGERAYFDFNEHWAPFHTLTFPCQIQYDFIGKLENQEKDAQQVLFSGLHMDKSVKFPTETRRHSTGSSTASAEKAYKHVSDRHMEQLREVYKLDFMLFDYDPHGFSWQWPFGGRSFSGVMEWWNWHISGCNLTNWQLWGTVFDFNASKPRQDGGHFPEDSFKCIFLNGNVRISIIISLNFV